MRRSTRNTSGLAAEHPTSSSSSRSGTINGKPIIALSITRDARDPRDGSRPAVLYASTQHAREWITAEQTRRLAHLFIDNYGQSGEAQGNDIPGGLAERQRELWIVPIANPDGYDYTFTPGNRLWRKNLRDNNGDSQITAVDGVDPNRNFATNWGFDNEGSSPRPRHRDLPRHGARFRARDAGDDGLLQRMGFEFLINYHSAADCCSTASASRYRRTPGRSDLPRVGRHGADPAIAGNPPGARL